MRIVLLLLFTTHLLSAQNAKTPQDQGSKIAYAVSAYDTATVLSQYFYNGQRYHFYDWKEKEHQFFETNEWRTGSVFYDGQQFGPAPFLYDIFLDQVVVRQVIRNNVIRLQSEKIGSFTIGEKRFVRLPKTEAMQEGFYEILHEGPTRILVRRRKHREEKIESMKVEVYYRQTNSCYALKDGQYHPIRSKRDILRLFPDQKSAIRKELRNHDLIFRKNREESLQTIAHLLDNRSTSN